MKISLISLVLLLNAVVLINAIQKNPYKVLNLPESATDDQIKQKFRELSKKYHPDRNNDPKAKDYYAEITNAYQTLTDPATKRKYEDELQREQNQRNGGNYNWNPYSSSNHQTKQSNYKKNWQNLFQKKHSQSYTNYFNNKKKTYQSSGSGGSKLQWIKNKISGFLPGSISEIVIYGAVIYVIFKVFGSLVHVQMGQM